MFHSSILVSIAGLSFNQPPFSPCAAWNSAAITFATNDTLGRTPFGIFINTNNTVYAASISYSRVVVWTEGYLYPTKNISGGLALPYALFVTNTGDVYVDNGRSYHRIDKWKSNTTNSVPAMYVDATCFGVFIDTNNTLYCCMQTYHQVIKQSLNSSGNMSIIAAGIGLNGSDSSMLSAPKGIFIDIYFNLYVADCGNHRIQRFRSDPYNGTAVVGNGASGTITLKCPTGVVLDADGYLFIVDSYNHRIVGSGPDGYRCLVACSGMGSSSTALAYPNTLSFDSHGNIFVTDWNNNRIQKFLLATNSCGKSHHVVSDKVDSSLCDVSSIRSITVKRITE